MTETLVLTNAPAEEDLTSVEKLIYQTIHAFRRRYRLYDHPEGTRPWDFDEMLSQAYEDFLRARKFYKEGKGAKFSTYVRCVIWRGMLDRLNRESRRTSRLDTREATKLNLPSTDEVNEVALGDASPDAQIVVKLALSPSLEMLSDMNGDTPRKRKRALVSFLKDLGWTMERILESFHEIAEVLAK